jgi:hypothetical protein
LPSCGEDPDTYLVTSIGWSFNYRDWTEPDRAEAPDDVRGCANRPSQPTTPAYTPVESVRVALRDPTGQSPGIDELYPCAAGDEGRRVRIIGIPRQVYELTLEAEDAAGNILYRYEELEHDLSHRTEQTYELRTATAELAFFPVFDGVAFPTCPPAVSTVHFTFHLLQDGLPAELATRVGALPACDSGAVEELRIRRIPVFPQPGANGNYRTTDYRLALEARDGTGATQYCGVNGSRPVRPGNNSLRGDVLLVPGACQQDS